MVTESGKLVREHIQEHCANKDTTRTKKKYTVSGDKKIQNSAKYINKCIHKFKKTKKKEMEFSLCPTNEFISQPKFFRISVFFSTESQSPSKRNRKTERS